MLRFACVLFYIQQILKVKYCIILSIHKVDKLTQKLLPSLDNELPLLPYSLYTATSHEKLLYNMNEWLINKVVD